MQNIKLTRDQSIFTQLPYDPPYLGRCQRFICEGQTVCYLSDEPAQQSTKPKPITR